MSDDLHLDIDIETGFTPGDITEPPVDYDPFGCDLPTVVLPGGRRPIGVNQPPGGGDQYPFVSESELKLLIADFYLAYRDETCQFVRPFSIKWIHGFGCDDVAVPITPVNDLDILIVDANDQTVFSSLTATEFNVQNWGALLRVVQWSDDDQNVCRLVQYGGWPADTEPVTFPIYQAPVSAILDERTLERRLPVVRSMRVDLGQAYSERIRWQNGHNTLWTVETPEVADGQRTVTYLTIDAVPGAGRGLFPADCDDEDQVTIKRINGVEADEHGNFTLDATGCHRIERPVFEVLETGARRAVAVIDHTLQLFNDCGPCCGCDDFINTYEGIRRLRDRYADLVVRANIVRTKYMSNLERFESQRACRLAEPLRLALRPFCPNEVAIAIGFCNNSGRCIQNLILPISFEYSDLAGDTYPDTPDPIAFTTEYAAGFGPVIPRNSIFRAGNISGNQQQGSGMIPELYELGGSYPHYYAAFDRVDPGGYASVVFRMQFPSGVATDTIRVGIDAYEGPSDISSTPSLAIPIPGYTPGGGPVTLAAKNRRLTSTLRLAETGLLPSCDP